MSKPLSLSIPQALRDWMADKGHTEKSFSLLMGKAGTWLNKLFKGESALSKYARVADLFGISLEELVFKIENRLMAEYINSKIKDKTITSVTNLAQRARVSEGFAWSLFEDSANLKTISSYIEISITTGITLDKLRRDAVSASITA